MAKNSIRTGSTVASKAGKALSNSSDKTKKSLAASALSNASKDSKKKK